MSKDVKAKLDAESAERVAGEIKERVANLFPPKKEKEKKVDLVQIAREAEKELEAACLEYDEEYKTFCQLQAEAEKDAEYIRHTRHRYRMACAKLEEIFAKQQRLKRILDQADPVIITKPSYSKVLAALNKTDAAWEKTSKRARKNRNRALKRRAMP